MIAVKQYQPEGFWNVVPHVKTVDFPAFDRIQVELEDGRIIIMPIDRFPSIQQLTSEQRQHWYKFGNGFSFDDSDEVIHIEQILGNFDTYRHES